jgi:hypothetical protein
LCNRKDVYENDDLEVRTQKIENDFTYMYTRECEEVQASGHLTKDARFNALQFNLNSGGNHPAHGTQVIITSNNQSACFNVRHQLADLETYLQYSGTSLRRHPCQDTFFKDTFFFWVRTAIGERFCLLLWLCTM